MSATREELLNRMNRAAAQVHLGSVIEELIDKKNLLLAKLDADGGPASTNYAETLYLGDPNPYTPADTTDPEVSSAVVDATGTVLTLTLSESLVYSGGGDYDGFVLTGSVSGARALSNPVRTFDVLVFDCEQVIEGETVTLDYSGGDLVDMAGNALGDITDGAVTNNSAYDGTLPTLQSATVDAAGTTLTLVFSEDISSVSGNYTGFAIEDSIRGALALSAPALDGDTLTFTCEAVYSGETITLDYSGADIVDGNDNALAAITDDAVTNNSAATP